MKSASSTSTPAGTVIAVNGTTPVKKAPEVPATAYILPCGLLTIFLYGDPPNLACHLLALDSFVQEWNNNTLDSAGKRPSVSANQAWPAKVLVVSSGHHLSNHSHKEPQHITLYVASAIGWGAVPRRSNACAHIYSVNHQVDGGYTGYWIKNSNTNHFQSNSVSSKLQRALDNVKLSPKLVCGVCGGFGCGCEEELEEEDGDDDDEDDEDYEDYYDDYGEYQDYQDYEDYEEEEEAEEEEEEA